MRAHRFTGMASDTKAPSTGSKLGSLLCRHLLDADIAKRLACQELRILENGVITINIHNFCVLVTLWIHKATGIFYSGVLRVPVNQVALLIVRFKHMRGSVVI